MRTSSTYTREELLLVRDALACILQENNPLPASLQDRRKQELSRRLAQTDAAAEDIGAKVDREGLSSVDLSLLSRLLCQVHQLIAEKIDKDEPSEDYRPKNVEHSNLRAKNLDEPLQDMIEKMVEAAGAAAEAANAVKAIASKNLKVMDGLLTKSEPLLENSHMEIRNVETFSKGQYKPAIEDEGNQNEVSSTDKKTKELVKKLERQNAITHWILGFMVLATAIWRFKLVSVVVGVRRTFTTPFEVLRGKFQEGLKWRNKEHDGIKAIEKARIVLPSLLGSDGNENSLKNPEEKKFKTDEALTLSWDSILSVGKSSLHESEEDQSHNHD